MGSAQKRCRTPGCPRYVWYFDTDECGECGAHVGPDGRKKGRRGGENAS